MIPLNLILAATLVNVSIDIYQIIGIFRDFTGTYNFATELLKSGFSSVVMGTFIIYGLVKSLEYRKVRLLFLAFLLLDLVFDVTQAVQSNGQTAAQVQAAMKQLSFPSYYLQVLLPILIGCCIVLMSAISFQMKKPFFFQYPQTAEWQSILLRTFSVLYYMETVLALILAITMFAARS